MEETRFVYEKIINQIIGMIHEEEYTPGSKLPGVRNLADKFGCNQHTVRKAITFLSEDGVIEQKVRLGTFVRRDTSYLVGKAQSRVQIVSMRRIGILLFPAPSEFSTSLLIELEHEAIRSDLQLEHHVAANWASANAAIQMMKRNNCRTVIFIGGQEDFDAPEACAFLRNAPLPVVLGRVVAGYENSCYEPYELFSWFDRETVTFQFRYFRALGFEHIAYFGRRGADGGLPDQYRYYLQCAEGEKLNVEGAFAGPDAAEVDAVLVGWETLRGKLAVVCYDDIEAMRLVIAARKAGWKLPEELRVMGVNNFVFSRHVDPPLSSVLFPYRYLADRMLRRALDFAEGKKEFSDFSLPPLEVQIRESCGGRMQLSEPELYKLLHDLRAVAAPMP